MKYQLIIQFTESNYNLDEIIGMEDKLDDELTGAEVDGHDIGISEANIFIHTNSPLDTFNQIKNILGNILLNSKIAYRSFNEDEFICLWPDNLYKFHIN